MDALLLCAVITLSSDDESETPPVNAVATSTSVVAATPVKSKSLSLCIGSRPSDHYFHSVGWFVCAEFFSAVFDPILIKLRHMLYVCV